MQSATFHTSTSRSHRRRALSSAAALAAIIAAGAAGCGNELGFNRTPDPGMNNGSPDAGVPGETDSGTSCIDNPIPDTPLYLRGSFNSWVADEDARLAFDCDSFQVTAEIIGAFEFKVADANWTAPTTFGGGSAGTAVTVNTPLVVSNVEGGPNLSMVGVGPMTFVLDVSESVDTPTLTVKAGGEGGGDIRDNATAQSMYFDSRALGHKSPFGAVTRGSPVTFTLAIAADSVSAMTLVVDKERLYENQLELEYTEVARVAMTRTGQDGAGKDRWQGSYTFADIAVYGYYFETDIAGDAVIYANNNLSIPYTRAVGAGGVGSPYYRPLHAGTIRRFRQTVYDPAFATPSWAQDAIYYYIFPERFRNGEPANDPTPGVDSYVGNLPVEAHPAWIDDGPWTPGSDRDGHAGDDDQYNNDFYGGDLQGIIEKLDYIADLGANTLYINPIFESPSNHKYDTSDFLSVDDNFGGDAQFDTLVTEAQARGIRILLDASLNHCSPDSPYMDRYGKYPTLGAFETETIRTDSAFYDWFEFNPNGATPDEKYLGWLGISTLANLNESDSYKDFAFRNADSVTRTWLQRGADGWRMDVAPWVEDSFWREWRAAVKEESSDALALAETWFDSSKYFLGDMFDTTMNYIFRDSVLAFAGGGNATDTLNILEMTREHYPPGSYYTLMNLLSTHDAPRALFQFGYDVGEPSFAVIAAAKQRLLLAILFQMTYPGAPTVFYGDEVGLTGGHDPLNRRTYPWADQGGNPDMALHGQIRQLLQMRRQNALLRRGTFQPLYSDDDVIVFLRRHQGETAIVALNNHDSAIEVAVDVAGMGLSGTFDNLLRNLDSLAIAGDQVSLTVPGLYGAVYVQRAD